VRSTNEVKEIKTAKLYSEIHPLAIEYHSKLKPFSPSYFDEEDNFFKRYKICLDAGCGLGNAANSMKIYGAAIVVGVDISFDNLKKAMELKKNTQKVYFIQANVLNLPFKDNIFEFIYCNGVLHHTISPYRGFTELTRCLKSKGIIYLGLYGKGGIISFIISFGRLIAKIIPYEIGKNLLSIIFKNKLLLCNLLDVLYVPILRRYTKAEVKSWFKKDYHHLVFIEGKVNNFYNSKLLNLFSPSCSTLRNRIQKLFFGEGWLRIKGYKK
jgi:ubiquinone/menaquinone biosynthesis C-methylase UbiE